MFRFLHTSDLHVGRTFGGFSPETAAILKRARLTAIDRLADAARAGGARDIVVCGDVFDGPGLADLVLRETLARLAGHGDMVWHLLPGNHDPAQAGGIWDRIRALGLPANVKPLLTATPVAISADVVMLPAPLTQKSSTNDPTAWFDQAPSAEGVIRIGVAHGSVQGFGGSTMQSIDVDPSRRISAGLDYMALGDWHGVREIAPAVWYSGTPEPDKFPDNEPGFALLVEIANTGAIPQVRPIATAAHSWLKRSIVLSDISGIDEIESLVASLGSRRSEALLELTLSGSISFEDDFALTSRLDTLEASLFHLRLERGSLGIESNAGEASAIFDMQLAEVARELEAMRQGEASGGTAERALRRLHQLNRKWAGTLQ